MLVNLIASSRITLNCRARSLLADVNIARCVSTTNNTLFNVPRTCFPLHVCGIVVSSVKISHCCLGRDKTATSVKAKRVEQLMFS